MNELPILLRIVHCIKSDAGRDDYCDICIITVLAIPEAMLWFSQNIVAFK